MFKFAALTKIFLSVIISASSLMTGEVRVLIVFCAVELAALLFVQKFRALLKPAVLLLFFAAILYAVQLVCGSPHALALVSALRMLIMSISILLLLAATKTQLITAALVKQCRMPYSYAFMITAVLRFVPDLLAESEAVREAQACRGYRPPKNLLKRLPAYMAVIKPMVFRAIQRSEHMAVSLELRGFSNAGKRTFIAQTQLGGIDYLAVSISIAVCYFIISYI